MKTIYLISVVLGALTLSSCLLSQNSSLLPRQKQKSGVMIQVLSKDPVSAQMFCESLRHSNYFLEVRCLPKRISPHGILLRLETGVQDSSRDYMRNAKLSLRGLTFHALITTSARTVFRLEMERPKLEIPILEFETTARTGMWAILPFYAGFLGTTFGTMLNKDRLPERLRKSCLEKSEKEACREYAAFMAAAFSNVKQDVWNDLQRISLKSQEQNQKPLLLKSDAGGTL